MRGSCASAASSPRDSTLPGFSISHRRRGGRHYVATRSRRTHACPAWIVPPSDLAVSQEWRCGRMLENDGVSPVIVIGEAVSIVNSISWRTSPSFNENAVSTRSADSASPRGRAAAPKEEGRASREASHRPALNCPHRKRPRAPAPSRWIALASARRTPRRGVLSARFSYAAVRPTLTRESRAFTCREDVHRDGRVVRVPELRAVSGDLKVRTRRAAVRLREQRTRQVRARMMKDSPAFIDRAAQRTAAWRRRWDAVHRWSARQRRVRHGFAIHRNLGVGAVRSSWWHL